MTNENEIADTTRSIKSEATGHDNIGNYMLILSCPTIIQVLTHLRNTFIEKNIFPNVWKIKKINEFWRAIIFLNFSYLLLALFRILQNFTAHDFWLN